MLLGLNPTYSKAATMPFLLFVLLIIQTNVLESSNTGYAVPAQYIVGHKVKHVSSQSDLITFTTTLENTYAANVIETIHIGSFTATVISLSEHAADKLSKREDVSYIEPNFIVTAAQGSDDEYHECSEYKSSNLWNLQRISKKLLDDPAIFTMSGADVGSGVDVYVFDTGIAIHHPDFGGRAKYSFKAPNLDYEDENDYSGHGTHVAGVIGSMSYGVAKNATLWSVKVLDGSNEGATNNILEGIEHVVNKFRTQKDTTGKTPKFICNLSLGSSRTSNAMDQAITEAIDLGITFVVAAGNHDKDACETSPARVRTAVTVAASDNSDLLYRLSNYGHCVDIIAPGVDILSIYLNGTRFLDGTSQAAPAVAGVMARILSAAEACSGIVLSPADVLGTILLPSTRDAISLTGEASSTPNKLLYMNCEKMLQLSGCRAKDTPEMPSNSSCPPFDDNSSNFTEDPICDANSCTCCADTYGQDCLQPLHITLIVCACVTVFVVFSVMSVIIIKRQNCVCKKHDVDNYEK